MKETKKIFDIFKITYWHKRKYSEILLKGGIFQTY